MDEPFTGLDPVNLALLREAFLELRDQGRTLIFSTHQMEAAEALCESVAIVDRGRVVAGGTVAELKRASGRRTVRLGARGRGRCRAWLAGIAGRGRRPARGRATSSSSWRRRPSRARSSRRVVAAARAVTRFEVDRAVASRRSSSSTSAARPTTTRRRRRLATAADPGTPA